MINAGYLNAECFPEMSQAELLCSTSDDALLWGLATAPCLCRNAKRASNKQEIFAVTSSFSRPEPCQSLPLCSRSPRCGCGNCFPLKSLSAGHGQEAAIPPIPPLRGSGSKPASLPFSSLGFKLQHQPPLQTSVLPSPLLLSRLLHLAFFVGRLFSSVMPLTFTRAPAPYLSSCLTTPLCDASFLAFPPSWLFFKILMA